MSVVNENPFFIVSLITNFVSRKVDGTKKLLRTIAVVIISLFYGYVVSLIVGTQLLIYRSKYFQMKKRETVPSCLNDKKLGKHEFISLKNIKLHYVANGDPVKPLMLLLHGFPEFWYSWRHQLKAFASDYYVVALDMRGYGDSDKPAGKNNYSFSKIIKDIHEFIISLNRKEAIIVGHDMGGAIAWKFASSYPQMVTKLIILNAPHPTNFAEVISTDLKQFLMSWYIFFFQLPLLPELVFLARDLNFLKSLFSKICTDEELEAYKYVYSKPGSITCPINYYRQNLSSLDGNRCIIQSPTLVIWGENDSALSLRLASGAAKFVNNNFTLRLIENGSHFIQTHKPEIVNRHMREFLDN